MQYKGYRIASIELDEDRRVLHGRVGIIGGGAGFEAQDAAGLIREFRKSVDVYLDACAEFGLTPGAPTEVPDDFEATAPTNLGAPSPPAAKRLA